MSMYSKSNKNIQKCIVKVLACVVKVVKVYKTV